MKKFKNGFYTILLILMAAAFIFVAFIFPMLYDLSKAGELNLHGIIKYIATIICALLIAGFIKGLSE